jgi:hypothetical protein
MGAPGADILYDRAYGAGGTAATRAKRSLTNPEVTRHASPELQIALDLRSANSCESKRSLLDRATTSGDSRTATILESYAPSSGCGFLGTQDCWRCMHKDGSLATATAKLRARLSL